MPQTYAGFDERPFDSHYLYTDTVIDYPIDVVWPRAINIPAWMHDHVRYESVSGSPGEVGNLLRVLLRDPGELPPPQYTLTGIAHIIPFKLITFEVFPEKGGSYGGEVFPSDYRGFDTFLFTDLGERTKVAFFVVSTSESKIAIPKSDEARVAAVQKHFDNLRELIASEIEVRAGS